MIYGSPVAQNASPLYAHLALAVADDPDVLALSADADQSTTVANLFFAAVHYLLMDDHDAMLAAYYPDLTAEPRPIEDAYPVFRAYCLEHAGEIRALVTTRRVQTNEVRRCAPLLPRVTDRLGTWWAASPGARRSWRERRAAAELGSLRLRVSS